MIAFKNGGDIRWRETLIEERGISPSNTFVPTIFRHTLIYAASRKLAPLALRQCSSGKAKYIEKSLHSLSFVGEIPLSSISCVLAKFSSNACILFLYLSICVYLFPFSSQLSLILFVVLWLKHRIDFFCQ